MIDRRRTCGSRSFQITRLCPRSLPSTPHLSRIIPLIMITVTSIVAIASTIIVIIVVHILLPAFGSIILSSGTQSRTYPYLSLNSSVPDPSDFVPDSIYSDPDTMIPRRTQITDVTADVRIDISDNMPLPVFANIERSRRLNRDLTNALAENRRRIVEDEEEARSLELLMGGSTRDRRDLNTYKAAGQARLYSVKREGVVRTTVNKGVVSVGADKHPAANESDVVEIRFLCQVAGSKLGPCPTSVPMLSSSQPDPSRQTSARSAVYQIILLYFRAKHKYLCINATGYIYLRNAVDRPHECALRHEFLRHNYDVYYSWKYPQSSSDCDIKFKSGSHSDRDSVGRSHVIRQATRRSYCRRRWYIGVSRSGSLRTFSVAPETSPPDKTLFIQRWIRRDGHNSVAHPAHPDLRVNRTSASLLREVASRGHSGDGRSKSGGVLGGGDFKVFENRDQTVSKHNEKQTGQKPQKADRAKTRNCSSLLRNCLDRTRLRPPDVLPTEVLVNP